MQMINCSYFTFSVFHSKTLISFYIYLSGDVGEEDTTTKSPEITTEDTGSKLMGSPLGNVKTGVPSNFFVNVCNIIYFCRF